MVPAGVMTLVAEGGQIAVIGMQGVDLNVLVAVADSFLNFARVNLVAFFAAGMGGAVFADVFFVGQQDVARHVSQPGRTESEQLLFASVNPGVKSRSGKPTL